jgi:hypothetical protein
MTDVTQHFFRRQEVLAICASFVGSFAALNLVSYKLMADSW